MTQTAAVRYELRWRKTSDPTNQWQGPVDVPASGNVGIPGLDRLAEYTFEARSVASCGAKSAWATQTHIVAASTDTPLAPTSLTGSSLADGVHLAWMIASAQAADVEYEIWRAPDSSGTPGTYTLLTQVRALAYTDPVTDGAVRWYMVRAVNYQGLTSAFSNEASSTGRVLDAVGKIIPTIQNPDFILGLDGWSAASGWTSDATPRAVYAGFPGASGTYTLTNSNTVACASGTQVLVEAQISASGATGTCYAGVEFLDSSGAHVAYAYGNTITGTAGITLSRKVAVAPSGSAFARFFLGAANCTAGTYYAQHCYLSLTLNSLDDLPDGTTRAGVTNGSGLNGVSSVDPNNKALIDFTQTGHTGKMLDNIGDGTTRFAVSNGAGLKGVSLVDGSNRAGIDFSQGVHLNKTLDYVGDGGSYLRGINNAGSATDIAVDNATFQLPLDPSSNIPGWSTGSDLPPNSFYLGTSSPSPYIGSQYAVVRAYGSACRAISSRKYSVSRGDVVTVGGYGAALNGQTCYIQAIFYTSAGAIISAANATFTSSSWSASNGSATVPSNAAYMRLALYSSSGSGYTYFAVNRVWCTVNDLRVPGSGATVGDQRNLNATTWAGVRSVLSTSPISYSISGTTVTFSVGAFSVNGGGFTVSYNAASGSVTQAAGTTETWFLYFRDAQSAGGSRTLYITSTPQDLAAYPDIVNIGSASVTVASGGGGTGGTGSGGGGWGGGGGTSIP